MRIEFSIQKVSWVEAMSLEQMFAKSGIIKNARSILNTRCLIAVSKTKEILSYAEGYENHKMRIWYFRLDLGRKQKSRMRAGFDSMIFSKRSWSLTPTAENKLQKSSVQELSYLFPG